jgi:mono/diheme cytochrome c family protein
MRGVLVIALALLAGHSAGHGALAADTPVALKPGPGAEVTTAYCNACHTSDYIIMNSPFLSPATWKAEVTKMRAVFGAEMDDAVMAEISAYLGANYAAPGKP